jgi:lipopolysaccharide transport system ATP-binding protein
MGNIAVSVDGLSKQYALGARRSNDTLRDEIVGFATRLFPGRRAYSAAAPRLPARAGDTIWALRDLSFTIEKGEVVGVIGRNGAGKSTLLKILSRITQPTRGTARIYGRVGSLLEIGAGFHGELTGRENIYLNGAILGMQKREITRKFDEIVSFAEVDKFLDTPVKRYSSGMYVRLAFAVAAHLEPDVLIVDEVLAVGDLAFQKKCLGKMGTVAKEGRTVLFVSHQLATIQALCRRLLLLEEGTLKIDGESQTVIADYLAATADVQAAEVNLTDRPRSMHSREPAIRRAWTLNGTQSKSNLIAMGESLTVCFEYQCRHPVVNPLFGFVVEDWHGRPIFCLNNYIVPAHDNTFKSTSAGIATLHIPQVPLLPGTYFVNLAVMEGEHEYVDYITEAIAIHVQGADVFGFGKIPETTVGVVFVQGCVSVTAKDDLSEGDGHTGVHADSRLAWR